MIRRRGAGDFGGRLTARLGRRAAAGPTVADAVRRAAEVRATGALVTCEYVAHPARTAGDADAARDRLIDVLRSVARSGSAADGAVDLLVALPVLGSRLAAAERVRRIAEAARATGTWLTVRPTGHADAGTVQELVSRMRPQFPDLGVEVWASLRRTAGDLHAVLAAPDRGSALVAPHPRVLLRPTGDRAVPLGVALPTPTDGERAFVRYAKRLLRGSARTTFGPADATLVGIVEALADAAPAAAPGTWWEILVELGRRPNDVERLLAAGRRVRVLVPFGPRWRAVGVRRAIASAPGFAR
jgi:hypothetical protein